MKKELPTTPSLSHAGGRLATQQGRGIIPSTRVEVLLPPLGSWKRRLLNRATVRRHTLYQRPASGSRYIHPLPSEARQTSDDHNTFYMATDAEFIEDADLFPEETNLGDFDVEDIPVRLLDDFVIYERDTLRLVPLTHLVDIGPDMHYGASGLVRPWIDDDDDDDDSDENDSITLQAVRLSPILELNVHHFSPSTCSLDAKIYLRTGICLHQVLHLLVTSALADPTINLTKFLCLQEVKGDTSVFSQVLEGLLDLSFNGLKLSHIPLIGNLSHQTVVTPQVYALSLVFFQQCFKMVKPHDHEISKLYNYPSNVEEVHGASPIIKWIQSSSMPSLYDGVRIGETVYKPGEVVIVLPGEDPDKVRRRNAQASSSQSLNHFSEYWFIKICYFFEDEDEFFFHGQWLAHGAKTLLQEAAHPNGLFLMNTCDNVPLCSIIQKCNLHWLAADEMEPLEDVGNKFYCSGLIWDEDFGAFVQPIQAPYAMPTQACASCDSQAAKKKSECPTLRLGSILYLGTRYHELDFIYAINEQDEDAPYIIAQILNISQDTSQSVQIQIRQLKHYADLVKQEQAFINMANWKKDEERLFFTLNTETISAEHITGKCYIQHPALISNLEKWLSYENHFYVQDFSTKLSFMNMKGCDDLQMLDLSTFSYCEECYEGHIKTLEKQDSLKKENRPLQALEIFSGAGGLSIGLEGSGFVETKWAIEYSPSAARTFQFNKHAKVYNQDCNLLLEHAIQLYNGKDAPLLKSLDNKDLLQPLPRPGEVEMICGGPPCQGFSHANRHPQQDDPRNALVCNMLSYVEFYRPKYFLLENVLGFLNHKLRINEGPQEGNLVAHGVVKFLLRALTSLGYVRFRLLAQPCERERDRDRYQVRFSVLQAGVYGSPQNRRRVIFWGARRGFPLPEFPIPTHNFESAYHWAVQLDTGLKLEHVARDPDRPHRGAPLRAVTVDDAISDLPKFDWKNPHVVNKATRADRTEVKRRAAIGIPAFVAVSSRAPRDESEEDTFPGYPDGVPYATPPRTRYQARVRQGIAEDADVELQYTARFSESVVERVCNIAIRPGADWRSLPKELSVRNNSPKESETRNDMQYSRVDGSGSFRTAITTVAPNAQGSTVIHPTVRFLYLHLHPQCCKRITGFWLRTAKTSTHRS
ncbi:S-adenosyl-L-methionine-dependent methyltransferase [Russula earlei]|uniref:S-adenosyl-L-methionine-dependent methyltransferase n=1 Tax=Russula earlei TaxID=71964 RepID=A0ACC0UIF8_9AGAM|nr:S-adenosyl-L-methionine-dependent methyltransferase [Russula earlei]